MSSRLDSATMRALLPPNFKYRPDSVAVSEALALEYQRIYHLSRRVLVFADIDNLAEPWLDLLAVDMHIDYYDATLSAPQKRELVKRSIPIHRKKGTAWAVEQVVSTIHGGAKVDEWYQYNGNPYMFRVLVDVHKRGIKQGDYENIIRSIETYKNVRSHLERISVGITLPATLRVGAAQRWGQHLTVFPYQPEPIIGAPATINIGAASIIGQFLSVQPKEES